MEIETSNGELVDKVSILKIKLDKIIGSEKLTNIRREFDLLSQSMLRIGISFDSPEFVRLEQVNRRLWDIEDSIRIKEANRQFDSEFIELARSVYFQNDTRAAIKKEINLKTGSTIVEEKQYSRYS